MVNWRPELWGNPYSAESDVLRHIEYENMADSIIESLINEGQRVFLPAGYVYQESALKMFCEELAGKAGLRGWIMFIPDKDSGENGVEGQISGEFKII